jgi:hypothetical protein
LWTGRSGSAEGNFESRFVTGPVRLFAVERDVTERPERVDEPNERVRAGGFALGTTDRNAGEKMH